MKEKEGLVEARFFGQHDRAMIPVHNCFLYSKQIPFPPSKKRLSGLNNAIKEAEIHVSRLQERVKTYQYAAHLTPYDPNRRYTTNSLAVMPDGKVKSLTDVGRNAAQRAKVIENGKDSGRTGDNQKEGVNSPTVSESTNGSEGDVVRSASADTKAVTSGLGKDHSYAKTEESCSKEESVPMPQGPDTASSSSSKEEQNASEGSVSSGEDGGEAQVEDGGKEMDEDSATSDRMKRKLSDASSDLPEKLCRTDSVDTNDDSMHGEIHGDVKSCKDENETDGGNADISSPADLLNSLDGILSSATPKDSKDILKSEGKEVSSLQDTPKKGGDDFSILPSRLPNLEDLEASVSSTESSPSPKSVERTSNPSTPIKDSFLLNLSKTIDTCKASLGLEEEPGGEEEGEEEEEEEDPTSTGDETAETEEEDGRVEDIPTDGKSLDSIQDGAVSRKDTAVESPADSDDGNGNEEDAMETDETSIQDDIDAGTEDNESKIDEQMEQGEVGNDEKEIVEELDNVRADDDDKPSSAAQVDDKAADEDSHSVSNEACASNGDSAAASVNTEESSNDSFIKQKELDDDIKDDDDDDDDDDGDNDNDDGGDNDDDDDGDNDDDDGDNDGDDDGGMYGVGSSSDGELQIDEGNDTQVNQDGKLKGTGERTKTLESDKTLSSVPTTSTKVGTEQASGNEGASEDVPSQTSGAEVAAKSSEQDSEGGKDEKNSGPTETGTGSQQTDSSEKEQGKKDGKTTSSKDMDNPLLSGAPTPPEKDPDYEKLIAKVTWHTHFWWLIIRRRRKVI